MKKWARAGALRPRPRARRPARGARAAMEGIFSRDVPGHSVVHHWNRFSEFVRSDLAGRGTGGEAWPERSELCCWHCTEPFGTQPIGIPAGADADGRVACDGNFCSYACALAYTFAFKTSHMQYKTRQLLVQAASDIHGITELRAAPPMLALQKFGGPLTIAEFRATGQLHSVVVNPPFVGHDLVFEMHGEPGEEAEVQVAAEPRDDAGGRAWSVAGLRAPAQSLPEGHVFGESEPLGDDRFTAYVARRGADAAAAAPAAGPTRSRRGAPDVGNLQQFVRAGS